MAVVGFINRKKSQTRAGMRAVIKYVMKEEKVAWKDRKLISGLNCSPESVYDEFINTKLFYGKDKDRMYYHFYQSFPKGENVSPEVAHIIALKLAEYYSEFEVLVCTHTDREHIHSHFIINSVSFETGKKLHQSAKAITELREISDNLCKLHGLSIYEPPKGTNITKGISSVEYHSAVKGESWKMRLSYIIDKCMESAKNKDMFIKLMNENGYEVKWTDTRKSITYTTPNGKRCRDNKLSENKYRKEMMEIEFGARKEIVYGGVETVKQTTRKIKRRIPTRHAYYASSRNTNGNGIYDGKSRSGTSKYQYQDGTAEHRTAAFIRNTKDPKRADERPEETNRKNGNADSTGWEKERAIFNSRTAEGNHTNKGVVNNFIDSNKLDSDSVQLNKSIERVSDTINDLESNSIERHHDKKKGIDQNEDNNSGMEIDM